MSSGVLSPACAADASNTSLKTDCVSVSASYTDNTSTVNMVPGLTTTVFTTCEDSLDHK
jgi:hypothetical protein